MILATLPMVLSTVGRLPPVRADLVMTHTVTGGSLSTVTTDVSPRKAPMVPVFPWKLTPDAGNPEGIRCCQACCPRICLPSIRADPTGGESHQNQSMTAHSSFAVLVEWKATGSVSAPG